MPPVKHWNMVGQYYADYKQDEQAAPDLHFYVNISILC